MRLSQATFATPAWRKERTAAVSELHAARQAGPADTRIVGIAALHKLVGGVRPGPEFTAHLRAGLAIYNATIADDRPAEFFLPGNRHHDPESGQTDSVALYDAAGLWLLEQGVPAQDMHGKDWMDESGVAVYNGAREIEVAAMGFQNSVRFEDAVYVCSPGQRRRAALYALAYGLPLTIHVPPELENNRGEQFHSPLSIRNFVAGALAQTIDPYGKIMDEWTRNRIPEEPLGTITELLPNYSGLPWYPQAA